MWESGDIYIRWNSTSKVFSKLNKRKIFCNVTPHFISWFIIQTNLKVSNIKLPYQWSQPLCLGKQLKISIRSYREPTVYFKIIIVTVYLLRIIPDLFKGVLTNLILRQEKALLFQFKIFLFKNSKMQTNRFLLGRY